MSVCQSKERGSLRHSKERGSLRCCIPLLCQWFISHLYKDIYMVETKGNHAWAKKLRSFNEKSILWYPKKIDAKGIIVNCGNFPNVPLIGSKGCINYIPMLAMSQFCHSVWKNPRGMWLRRSPKKCDLEGFILHNEDNFLKAKKIKTERSKRQKTLGGWLGVGFNLTILQMFSVF